MEDRIDFQETSEEHSNFGDILTMMIVLLAFKAANIEETKEKAYEE